MKSSVKINKVNFQINYSIHILGWNLAKLTFLSPAPPASVLIISIKQTEKKVCYLQNFSAVEQFCNSFHHPEED